MHRIAAVMLTCSVFAVAAPVFGQAYPIKPVRILVPFLPGGTPDIQIRMLAERLTPRLNQQFVIDNRAGASGNIGMEIAARAAPDGYTFIIGTVGNWTVNPHLYKLPYDVMKDFAPVINLATTPAVLVVHPSVPAQSVKELIALAAREPGKLNYGSSGVGGFGHICAELFGSLTKTKMTHVPYKGVAIAMTELIGGHIHVLFNSAVPTLPHIKANRVRGLATTGASRVAILSELPTVAEAGVPGYENTTWSMIAAPSRTPRALVERMNAELNAVLELPDIRERFVAAGSTIVGGTPAKAQEIMKSEFAKYGKLIADAQIAPAGGTTQ